MAQPHISVIVPTLNEAENLPLLVPRIAAALAGREYEILIVDDDSRDDTVAVCGRLSQTYPLRLIVRQRPKDGLSGAVLAGMAEAQGQILAVMDADLQHPPEKLPELLAVLNRGEGDFALGSRYVPGGSTERQWGLFRRINSSAATLLARPFSGPVHDPMSGFFALHRDTYARAQRLTPLGYKIALELMCKCRVKRVVEVPIHFARRQRGQSKLTLREQFRYLEHLSRLYDFKYPRLSPYAKFVIATSVAWLVGFAVMMMAGAGGLTMPAAMSVGYVGAIAATAVFHLRYVRTQREFILTPRPWLAFWVIAGVEWTAATVVAWWLHVHLREPTVATVFVLSFGWGVVVRYVLRKELVLDLRGLGRELRREDIVQRK